VDAVDNPYRPGAGLPPAQLAGRGAVLAQIGSVLDRALAGIAGQTIVLVGERGVGKTVLLDEVGRTAAEKGFLLSHFELYPGVRLAPALVRTLSGTLQRLSTRSRGHAAARRALGALKAFSIAFPGGPSFSVDIEATPGVADSGDLVSDVGELFTQIGMAAQETGSAVLLTLDEMHFLDESEEWALIRGLHAVGRNGYPVVLVGASVVAWFTDDEDEDEVSTYRQRLYRKVRVPRLTPLSTAAAVVDPARARGVEWQPDAVQRIFDLTGGRPYEVQRLASEAWLHAGASPITVADVDRAAAAP
jgi:hypothetical protein